MPSVCFHMAATASEIRRGAPAYGEHTREVLAELDYTEAEIDALLSSGAAVAADLVFFEPHARGALLQVARQHLDRRAAVAEEDRLVRGAAQARGEPPRLLQRVRA